MLKKYTYKKRNIFLLLLVELSKSVIKKYFFLFIKNKNKTDSCLISYLEFLFFSFRIVGHPTNFH